MTEPSASPLIRFPSRNYVIECAGCRKQRWGPRCIEALLGWVQNQHGYWFCPECQGRKVSA